MIVPEGMTETEVLQIIDKIADRLSYKFTFGYFERDDIKQEARIIAMEGLEDYRPGQPLENFLWVHVKNRLCNFKRKRYARMDKPCTVCPIKAWIKDKDQCTAFQDKMECHLYKGWVLRNERKKNVINPVSMHVIVDETETNMYNEGCMAENLYTKELVQKIDAEISMGLRPLWLQAKAGIKLHAEDMRKLTAAVLEIVDE